MSVSIGHVACDTLKDLAIQRLREARVLRDARHYDGAYYMAGYAVEFALKAIIAKKFAADSLPDKALIGKVYEHDPSKLIGVAGLRTQLKGDMATDAVLQANWQIIKDWTEQSRYVRKTKNDAKDIIRAVGGPGHSFMWWVRKRW